MCALNNMHVRWENRTSEATGLEASSRVPRTVQQAVLSNRLSFPATCPWEPRVSFLTYNTSILYDNA